MSTNGGDAADREAWAELFGLAPPEPEEEDTPRRRGLFRRLRENLAAGPRQTISPQLAGIYQGKLVTAETWDDLEEALISADCGMDATLQLVEELREEAAQGRITSGADVSGALWKAVAHHMAPEPARIGLEHKPTVILVVGVNGSGKTTTVGKLAYRLSQLGQSVVIGAADTFRAAAIDQLAVWAERSGAHFVRQSQGADPGAVAYDTVASAKARGADVALIDTAGRLQTQHNLMEELRKVAAVVRKVDDTAPHEVLLVLDATTGQNGLIQARVFAEVVDVSGIVLTKLDGTAKGGIVFAIANELKLPIRYLGVGESVEDFVGFEAAAFVDALLKRD